MRYKSRINSDEQGPDAVDGGDQPSFSLDSSIFGSLKVARTPQPQKIVFGSHRAPTDLFSREPEAINKSLGFNHNDVYSFSDLFGESDSENGEQEQSTKKRRRTANANDNSVKSINPRKKVPGLRKISRQVINAIRSSEAPLTYKEVSDLVTDRNYEAILAEVDRRNPEDGNDESITSNKAFSPSIKEGELNEQQFRAVENYRRRIYDAWSVLRASNIIVQTDSKRYRYNSNVLEGCPSESRSTVTIDAEKLEKIERFMEKFESVNQPQPKVNKTRRINLDEEEQWNHDNNVIQRLVRETENEVRDSYSRIKDQLKQLSELSQSNLSLKRLIKRNAKRDAKIKTNLGRESPSTKSDGSCSEDCDKNQMRCKLPFVVAVYQPDRHAAYNRTSKGRSLGMLHKGNYVKVASKRPIKCFDDRACLDYMDLGEKPVVERDEDDSCNHFGESPISRENKRLSRKFTRDTLKDEDLDDASVSSPGFDLEACLEEILERLPTGRRTRARH